MSPPRAKPEGAVEQRMDFWGGWYLKIGLPSLLVFGGAYEIHDFLRWGRDAVAVPMVTQFNASQKDLSESQKSLAKAVENMTGNNDGFRAMAIKVDALVMSDQVQTERMAKMQRQLDLLTKGEN